MTSDAYFNSLGPEAVYSLSNCYLNMNRILLLGILFLQFKVISAQTSVFVRNSTWQDFEVEAGQSGTLTMSQSEWSGGDPILRGWLETTGQEILTVNRTNNAVPEGDTAFFDMALLGSTDALTLKLRIIGIEGGTQLSYSIEGNGFSEPWFDDGDFHEVLTTLAGKPVVIKFKPDNDDSTLSRDLRFAIHDLPVYELEEEDLTDPNVLNVMFYNIQMINFGLSGMPQANERGALLPAQLSPNQDVVVYCEAFDDGPREDFLIPAMQAAGFPYRTSILNAPGFIPIPTNGGVIIFSRWPIEAENEIDFSLCGQASQDCLSNKGVKYARVNKLGKRYHVFGTHMDAGGAADDLLAKRQSYRELREFIIDLNIPEDQPVLYGGDFNTSPNHGDLYLDMLDSLHPILPLHTGFYESNFSDEFGQIIDHAWGDRTHLVPLTITNEIITVRSIDPVLWDLSEFSDHRCVLGRYVYPDFEKTGGDTVICPGDGFELSIETAYPASFQWFKDGVELSGENAANFSIANGVESQSGNYTCLVSYDVIYGQWGDPLTAFFYPNGVDTVEARLNFDFGDVVVDDVLCQLGVDEADAKKWTVFPNPASGTVNVSCADSFSKAEVSIISSTGSVLHTSILTNSNLDIDLYGLAAGMYVLRMQTDEMMVHHRLLVY